MSDLISAPAALTLLARCFDKIADTTMGLVRNRAAKSAAQLRFIAQQVTSGNITTDEAWMWADTAAGQLQHDDQQLAHRARQR